MGNDMHKGHAEWVHQRERSDAEREGRRKGQKVEGVEDRHGTYT